MMQAKMVNDTDSREGKLALYRNTIKTQEEVRRRWGPRPLLSSFDLPVFVVLLCMQKENNKTVAL